MTNLEKARNILQKLATYEDEVLLKDKSAKTLFKLLENHLPEGLLEDVKDMDNISVHKKRALIDYLLKIIDEISKNRYSTTENDKKEIQKSTIDRTFFKTTSVQDLKSLLKPIEKKAFKKVGVSSLEDAFFFFPKKYEDRRFKPLSKVKDGETAALILEVVSIKKIKRKKLKTEVLLKDGKSFIKAYFVHDKPFLFNIFRKGSTVVLYGKVKYFNREKSIVQPEIYRESDIGDIILGRIVPTYSLKGDSSIKTSSQTINHLRRGIYKILKKYAEYYPEYIPEYLLKKYKLPHIKKALPLIHFPPEKENIDLVNDFEARYQLRFIFDELLLQQLAFAYRKYMLKQRPSHQIVVSENFLEQFENALPFKLTNAQKRAIKEILNDISKPEPMNRMLQGDVGSGKTVVAAATALATVQNGKQIAVMAPTEILAYQHYQNFKQFLEPFGIKVVLLTGSIPAKEKKKIYKEIEEGKAEIVVGTHALIQDQVKFKNLAVVIVDEQHRFGVVQRKALVEKSDKIPHTLVMTATPIPRTLTIANYGDLDVSKLDELPAGRKPVKTILLFDDERKVLYERIRKELDAGRQAFVVYPLIEESEKIDLKSAEEGFKHYQEAFPDKKVLLLHGKMKQEEKDKIMKEFKEGKADILVSTTVIEVGVDVPNASVMVIEEAHRFGLSQIHQLRGRIGRGEHPGYCFLVAPSELRKPSEKTDEENRRLKTLERLKILVKMSDGFKIAEEDLKLRGSGEVTGTAQSGKLNLSIVDFERPKDNIILEVAKEEAENLIKEDPKLSKYPLLKEKLFEKYAHKLDLVNVA